MTSTGAAAGLLARLVLLEGNHPSVGNHRPTNGLTDAVDGEAVSYGKLLASRWEAVKCKPLMEATQLGWMGGRGYAEIRMGEGFCDTKLAW